MIVALVGGDESGEQIGDCNLEADRELIALAPDMARELLRLHDGVEQLREMCLLERVAAFRETGTHVGAANAYNNCAEQLTGLLEGDTE